MNSFLIFQYRAGLVIDRLVLPIIVKRIRCINHSQYRGAGRGKVEYPPTPKAKNCCRKWCYFPELYKITKVEEDGIEKGEKVNFPFRFLYVNFKNF